MARSPLKILAIAAIVGVLGFKLLQQGGNESRFQTMPGHVADFTAVNIDGGKSTYLEMKGTPTLIVLSASWCPACMAEIPMLKKIHEELKGESYTDDAGMVEQKGYDVYIVEGEYKNIKITTKTDLEIAKTYLT